MTNPRNLEGIKPGDLYEDCAYHPVLCIGVDKPDDDEVWGISLIDGSQPRSCSIRHCGVRKLSIEEAWVIKVRYEKTRKLGPESPEI